jgi:hypothetical protein
MESEYSFVKKENYLMMTVTGNYAKQDFMSFADIILERCEEENMRKVLIDAHTVTFANMTTMDRFYIGENIAKVLGPRIKLTAIFPKEHINKFGENVAVNRGGKLFVTHAFEEAEEWLLNDTR